MYPAFISVSQALILLTRCEGCSFMIEQKAGEVGRLTHMNRMNVLVSRNAVQRGDEIRSQSCKWGLVTGAWAVSSKVY